MKRLVFSSDDLPPELDERTRFNRWRDIFAWRYGSADFTRLADQPFKARSEFVEVRTLGLVRSESTVQRFKRTSQQAADGSGAYLIAFNNGVSPTTVNQRGREQVCAPEQMWLGSTADAIDVGNRTGTRWVTLIVPASALLQVVPLAEDMVARPLDATRPAIRHLRRYAEFLLTADEVGDDNGLTGRLDTMLLDLVALSLGGGDSAESARSRGLRAARLQAVLQAIKADYADPALSSQTVAHGLGLSRRYVNDLLYETGSSFSERVLELRLQKARAMLFDPAYDRMKISDIAYACGFNEVSYFNRCFRRRFGASPTQFRR